MRKLLIAFLILLPSMVSAQNMSFKRYDCLGANGSSVEQTNSSADVAASRRLPAPSTQWDSSRSYPVAVVLVEFSDLSFSMEKPSERYDSIFNRPGYNEGKGPGCVADYFRAQSDGLFSPRFDIYGPVNIGTAATSNGNYGGSAFRTATQKLVDSLHVNLAPYDWDGNGTAESIIYVYAGYGGNEGNDKVKGHIWPNTSSFSAVLAADGVKAASYSASAELWSSDRLCGIGTICHEYTHALGLPDIYPTQGDEYSVVDEWDLMDGGNFINNGWCPPNYSSHEKMLLGWKTPIELTDKATIAGMKAVSEGGDVYIVRSADNPDEFYLLENRQWTGWDLRVPGSGLLVLHVDYKSSAWSSNTVNNTTSHHRYDLVHADNLDYNAWDDIIGNTNPYVSGHSRILSGSPYPYVADDVTNNALTDTSVPVAAVYSGTGLMSKPITNIQVSDDGLVSFDFMGGDDTGIRAIDNSQLTIDNVVYDLQGRRVVNPRRGVFVVNGKKIVIQ